MTQSHWSRIFVSLAALAIVVVTARHGGQVSPAAPSSPLTFFSSPVGKAPRLLAEVYLPLVARNAGGSQSGIYLPLIVWRHPRAKASRAPTPQPTPDWPAALSQPGRSKLGLHVIQNNTPHIMEFIRRTKPAVVKGLGGFGWASDVKKASPETVTVGRLLEDPDEGIMSGDPEAAAQAFVARHLAEYLINPGVDYWEGWNEPVPGPNMAWYARFEAERARRMADHGLRAAIGGFATGTPEWDEFVEFLPAIQAALDHGGILTLHEYAAPTMDYRVGEALPGHPAYPDRGLLTLRYRWWYEDLLKPRGLVIPLVISEGGIDGQVKQDLAPPGLGWRDFVAYWAQQGLGAGGAETYIEQLAWYDGQLQGDDYVLGVAIFTAGSPPGQWKSFDITAMLSRLAKYVVSQQ
ncbi:MAG: hypothetical protein JSV36_20100 [Anaerolineae bacterium]|nr:MAG: hypothetical protein JSV36_20100 [Anaerolineae bacterium]